MGMARFTGHAFIAPGRQALSKTGSGELQKDMNG
jgi:hypothetical protein